VTGPDPLHYAWWLAARASGVVALGLVTASVGIGLAMADGVVPRRPALKRALLAVHEQTALAALVAIVLHGALLTGDRWLRPGITGILVPFAMSYRPLFTGLGILAGYLAALLGLSFYLRRRIGARLWRKAHRFTVVVYGLAVVHTLGAGTDAGSAWLRLSILATAAPIAVLLVLRVLPRRRARRTRRPVVLPVAVPPNSR
jgi:methionine sulfoxide reductase heme-binding subunit